MFKLSDYFHIKCDLAGEPSAPGGEPAPAAAPPASSPSLLGGDPAPSPEPAPAPVEPFLKELPGAEDKDAWNAVYAKLGRPDTAEGYELPVPEGDTGEFAKTSSSWMHEAGLNKSQAQALAGKWNEHVAAQNAAQQAAIQKQSEMDMASVKQEWGANFEANKAIVSRAINEFAPPEFVEMLSKSGLINSPIITNMFLKIGNAIGEDKSVSSPKGSPQDGEQSLAHRLWPGMS